MIPTSTGKMRVNVLVRENSGNFERTRKLREFYPIFIFLVIELYLLNRFLYLVNSLNKTLGKWGGNAEKV